MRCRYSGYPSGRQFIFFASSLLPWHHTILIHLPASDRMPDCGTGKYLCNPSEAFSDLYPDLSKNLPRPGHRSWKKRRSREKSVISVLQTIDLPWRKKRSGRICMKPCSFRFPTLPDRAYSNRIRGRNHLPVPSFLFGSLLPSALSVQADFPDMTKTHPVRFPAGYPIWEPRGQTVPYTHMRGISECGMAGEDEKD